MSRAWLPFNALAPALALVLSLAVGAPACAPTAQLQESWTVCIYLCGSDLETKHARATHTLAELMEADVPANVTVVVQTGGARTWRADGVDAGKTQRFVLRDHGLHELEAPPAASMGDAGTLAGFLEFCAGEYPSDRSMAVLWDHGGGPARGICFDETSGYDALTLSELDEAFSRGLEARGGRPYDIIGMDACLMATLETAVSLEGDAGYLVASEEIEPGAGWDYDTLLEALGGGADDAAIARAICDGYLAKCAGNGKDASATLSAIDLSKAASVQSALDDAIGALVAKAGGGSPLNALSGLVWATSEAQSFGGETAREGRSNLYDLGELASLVAGQGSAHAETFAALADAVDGAVAYSVAGTASEGATGLSLYYPANYDAADFRDYCAETPLSAYAGGLSALYSLDVRAVEFADAGSIDDEGRFQVSISPETLGGVFDVYIVNCSVGDDSHYETNIDILDDWEGGTFAHAFDDCTFALNGVAIDTEMIDYDEDYTVYSAPISLNGQETNLRIAEVAVAGGGSEDDDDDDEWEYEVLGTWNGIDHLTGLSDRSLDSLEPGDVVGCMSALSGLVRDEVTIGGEATVELAPLAPGTYECWFVVIDFYGNETASDVLTYRVSEPSAAERAEGAYPHCEPVSIAGKA